MSDGPQSLTVDDSLDGSVAISAFGDGSVELGKHTQHHLDDIMANGSIHNLQTLL
jgi:hypothetical protein